MLDRVRIIGAGLAGSEVAWQLAEGGIKVDLFEMRPKLMTKAHKTGKCAELVCSNSLRGAALTNAVGLLKEELRLLGSLVMQAADANRLPAGGALAVDREGFSAFIDDKVRTHPNITFQVGEVSELPQYSPTSPLVIATGPLTSPALAKSIESLVGAERLAFFDAISPVIVGSTIDREVVFAQSRYDKGAGQDYLNIPLDKEQYHSFVEQIISAEKFGGHEEVESDRIDNLRPFEGCMPIEDMAARGIDTLRHGPLKPVGLRDPRTGTRPWAVVQLRQDNADGSLWNMVGMQTRMKHPEQLRVLKMLPGLANAEFARLGSVHRNSFIQSPLCLKPTLDLRNNSGVFFAGQITGVEGYVESTASALVASYNIRARNLRLDEQAPPPNTACGALAHYISDPARNDFQPMNISFGLIAGYNSRIEGAKKSLGKDAVRLAMAQEALDNIVEWRNKIVCAQ